MNVNQQGSFTKENIDKKKILISIHAKDQFIMRVGEAHRHFRSQNETRHACEQSVGLPIISTHPQAEYWIRFFLERSTAEHAATNGKNVDAILKYLKTGEATFFLRYKRWQFVIKQCTENPDRFVVKTVIWLDDWFYSRIKK